MTRKDKSYCRKWLRAFRKGLATKEITLDWLRALRGPENKTLLKSRGIWRDCWSTVEFGTFTVTEIGGLDDFDPPQDIRNWVMKFAPTPTPQAP